MNASGGGVTASGGEAILQAGLYATGFAPVRRYPHISTPTALCAVMTVIDELLDVARSGDARSQADVNDGSPESEVVSLITGRWNSRGIYQEKCEGLDPLRCRSRLV